MTRVLDEPAVVLHTRPYRESSLIVTLFSLNHGKVSLVAKGLRGGKRGRAMQPFTVVRLGWTGRTSLGTLTGFEIVDQPWFGGNVLACAFYLSELVVRLLGEREAHPRLYVGLVWSLENVESDPSLVLRSFEKLLLEELGYGLDFERNVDGRPITEGEEYELLVDRGFITARHGYPGYALQCIAREDFSDQRVRQIAKSIFREALAHHLGPKPLLSRRLLVGGG